MADPSSASGSGSPPSVPSIGVGTWAWGNQFLWGYEPGQDAVLQDCFRTALDLGLRFFDTADSYGTGRFNGRSETLLGRFCAALPEAARQDITVATKLAPFPWRLGRQGFRRAFAASRHRLQGKLDRVQLHWSTARYAPWQEQPLLDGLADLVQRGEVKGMGVSNLGARRLRQVHARLAERGVALRSVQVQFSLLAPGPLAPGGLAEVCRELGIELIAYSPLALGLLARPPGGAAELPRGPRGVLFHRLGPRIEPLLDTMAQIAAGHGASIGAVALNWCRAHGALPIPGLRKPAQAEAAAAALAWQLTPVERQELDRLAFASEARMPANPFQSV
jgi:pyridoxine 4-dehydrogenase